jgi:hypothetical protein
MRRPRARFVWGLTLLAIPACGAMERGDERTAAPAARAAGPATAIFAAG